MLAHYCLGLWAPAGVYSFDRFSHFVSECNETVIHLCPDDLGWALKEKKRKKLL